MYVKCRESWVKLLNFAKNFLNKTKLLIFWWRAHKLSFDALIFIYLFYPVFWLGNAFWSALDFFRNCDFFLLYWNKKSKVGLSWLETLLDVFTILATWCELLWCGPRDGTAEKFAHLTLVLMPVTTMREKNLRRIFKGTKRCLGEVLVISSAICCRNVISETGIVKYISVFVLVTRASTFRC